MVSAHPANGDELTASELVRASGADEDAGRATSRAALSSENAFLRQTIALFDRLTTTALAGADVAQVAAALASSLGQAVIVLDADFELIAASAFGAATRADASGLRVADDGVESFFETEDPRVRQALETVASKHLPLRLPRLPGSTLQAECILAPISQGDDILGFLAVTTERGAIGEDLDLLSVQHAASIFALALLQEHRDEEMRARYKRELLEGLLLGQPSRSRAAELAILVGLVPDVPYWVIAIAPVTESEAPNEALLAELARSLDKREPGSVAIPRQGHVAILVAALEDDESRRLGQVSAELRDLLSRRFPGQVFALGASTRVPDPSGLGLAISQAQRAMAVARRLRIAGEVMTYEGLGIHRLLLHVPEAELDAFCDDVLGPLLEYDRAHASALLETLGVYLAANENLRRTAERLFVHVNTVNYRLRRIEAITGLDLADSQQRLIAEVALETVRLLEPAPERTR